MRTTPGTPLAGSYSRAALSFPACHDIGTVPTFSGRVGADVSDTGRTSAAGMRNVPDLFGTGFTLTIPPRSGWRAGTQFSGSVAVKCDSHSLSIPPNSSALADA